MTNGAALGTATGNLFSLNTWTGGGIENGASTFLLVSNYTGSFTSTDLDTNDDGVFDETPWDAIIDSIGVNVDADDSTFFYSPLSSPPALMELPAPSAQAALLLKLTAKAARPVIGFDWISTKRRAEHPTFHMRSIPA